MGSLLPFLFPPALNKYYNYSTSPPTLVIVHVSNIKCSATSNTVIPVHEMVAVPFVYKHQREHPSQARCWTLRTGADWCESVTSKTPLVGLPASPAVRLLLHHCLCCCFSGTRVLEDRNRHQVSDIWIHELALHFYLLKCQNLFCSVLILRLNSWQVSL